MIGFIKKLFGGKPAEQTAEVPYKVETAPVVQAAPVNVQAEGAVEAPAPAVAETSPAPVVVETAPAPAIEAVIVVPEAVVPAVVVEQAPVKQTAPKKQQPAMKPAAPKTAKPKQPRKPKAKPAA